MLPRVVESLLGRDIVMLACGVYHTMALSGEGATIKRRGGGVSINSHNFSTVDPMSTFL